MSFRPISGREFVAMEFPDTTLVDGGLLHLGSRLILGGEPGAGKSYLLTQLLLEAAVGEPWLGLWPIRRPLVSVMTQTEITKKLLQDRLKRWGTMPDGFFLLTTKQFSVIDELGGIIDFADSVNAELMAFDPLYQMHSGDENAVHTIRPIEDAFDSIAGERRAIALCHHYNKASQFVGGKPGLVWLRGSSAWAGWADTVMLIVSHPSAPAIRLHIVKARNRADRLPGVIELAWRPSGKFFEVVEVGGDSEFADLMAVIGEGILRKALVAKELTERRGCSRGTAYRVIAKAVGFGLIEEVDGELVDNR